jgi:sarcosine oxidase gamma subunit
MKTNYHVTKRGPGQWAYKKEGSTKATGIAPTQAKAEKLAKEIVKNQGGGDVRIHGLDGKIRDSDTVRPILIRPKTKNSK